MISKIEGRKDLERRGPAIVSVDQDGFLAYVARREKAEADAKVIQSLKDEVSELKAMLHKLIGEKNDSKPNPG